MLSPFTLVDASHAPIGNEAMEEYRAPWPERYRFIRDGGCPVHADTSQPGLEDCTAHKANTIHRWAIDMNDFDRPGDGDCGDPLRAARWGSVQYFSNFQLGGYGAAIGIRHIAFNGGLTSTWYTHLNEPSTSSDAPWDSVYAQGDWIGALGNTEGFASPVGCHLHFQLNLCHTQPGTCDTSNLVLSGRPFIDGYDLTTFSERADPNEPPHSGAVEFRSNNTGPGYCRPGAPPAQDPGPATAPCNSAIRNYVRNHNAFTIDLGSTKASSRGVCGANRRWVKTCPSDFGLITTQGFAVRNPFTGEYIPRALVVHGSAVYSIEAQFWKAYGRRCPISGQGNQFVYERLGSPVGEDYVTLAGIPRQDFEGGCMTMNLSDPLNIRVSVTTHEGGCPLYSGLLDLNNDPCYDVETNGVVGASDLGAAAGAFGNETNAAFNDRFDVDRNGSVGAADLGLIDSQVGLHCN